MSERPESARDSILIGVLVALLLLSMAFGIGGGIWAWRRVQVEHHTALEAQRAAREAEFQARQQAEQAREAEASARREAEQQRKKAAEARTQLKAQFDFGQIALAERDWSAARLGAETATNASLRQKTHEK